LPGGTGTPTARQLPTDGRANAPDPAPSLVSPCASCGGPVAAGTVVVDVALLADLARVLAGVLAALSGVTHNGTQRAPTGPAPLAAVRDGVLRGGSDGR
jgi:hypothetical protein